jgi:hypothetical protein
MKLENMPPALLVPSSVNCVEGNPTIHSLADRVKFPLAPREVSLFFQLIWLANFMKTTAFPWLTNEDRFTDNKATRSRLLPIHYRFWSTSTFCSDMRSRLTDNFSS